MLRPRPSVLIVDPDDARTESLAAFLRSHDFDVIRARDEQAAHNVIEAHSFDALVGELRAQRVDGMSVLRSARERHPELCAVMVIDAGDVELGIEAMRQGAYDFQVRPLQLDRLLAVLRRGLSHQALAARLAEDEARLDERAELDRFDGGSRAIQRLMDQVRAIATTRAPVLIEGEAGTGKSLVAEAIHRHSPRHDERFVAVKCETAPEVLDSELFGYQGAALTGSDDPHPGRIEQADRGTLYLDEIGAAPESLQVKLLRLLQERAFERVGGADTLRADVRLVASTRRELEHDAQFRADLLQRLGAARIKVPALRDRREDIPLLIEAFVQEFNREHRRRVTGVTRGALERMTQYAWPGNVRELRNTIEGMVVFAEGRRPLELSALPEGLRQGGPESSRLEIGVGMTVDEAERRLIAATLQHLGYDKPAAAAMLGIGLRTLYRKIKQYGLH